MRAGVVALAVVALDQLTKCWVRHALPHEMTRDVIPGLFALTHRLNPGVAFSMFHSVKAAPVIFSIISAAAIAFIAWLLTRHPALPLKVVIAFGMVAGGAAGNLVDRILPPHRVVDFLDFYIGTRHWPAFNIADTAICIAAGLLILASFTDPRAFDKA